MGQQVGAVGSSSRINLGRLIVLYYDVTRLPASSRATAVALETCSSGAPHAGVPYDSRVARRMASVTRHTKAPRVSARNGQRSETSPIAAARKRATRRSAPLHAEAPRLPCRSAETGSDPQSNPLRRLLRDHHQQRSWRFVRRSADGARSDTATYVYVYHSPETL